MTLPVRVTNEERKQALLKVLAARKRGTLPKHVGVAYHDHRKVEIVCDADARNNMGGSSQMRADAAIADGAKLLAWCDKTFGPAVQKDTSGWTRIVKTRYIGAHNTKVPVDVLTRRYALAEVTVPVEHQHSQVYSHGHRDGNGHMIWTCRSCDKKLSIRERRALGLIPPK
jgi:hypothetical protein